MDEGKKKIIIIVIVVGALAAAGIITFTTKSSSTKIPDRFSEETVWLKCSNPDCQNVQEVNKKQYYEYLQKNQSTASLSAPPMKCDSCGQMSCFKAYKCKDCNLVFSPYAARSDFPDICPKCGSRTEQ
jgi:hypothetical protein